MSPGRERIRARRVALAAIVAIAVFQLGHLVLGGIFTGTLTDQGLLLGIVFVSVTLVFSAAMGAVGWAIVTRQPRNAVGWLLLAIPLMGTLALFAGDYAMLALVTHPGVLPFGRFAAWVDRWAIVPALVVFIPIFLLFPDGRIPSRRWRPVLWLTVGAPIVTIVSFALTPGRLTGAFADLRTVRVTNPLGIEPLGGLMHGLTLIGGMASFGCAILAGAAIVTRFKGSSGEVRQQIRWLAFVGAAILVEIVGAIVAGLVLGNESKAGQMVGNAAFGAVFFTLVIGIPVACAVAILKYRLYDLDVVIRKAVVFGLLAVFITVVYAGIVGTIGALAGSAGSTTASFAAAATLAVLFAPARDRARKVADRLTYGKRSTPYEVLSEFSAKMGGTYGSEDVLPRMAEVLGRGTGAESATVWLAVAGAMRSAATWPVGAADPRSYPPEAIEVRHQGELLGALSVVMPASDPMDPAKRKLSADLASQAGLVLRNVGLIEELRASRKRIVAARDEERRQLERNIHDGAQQQLVALQVKLRLAEQLAERDAKKAGDLVNQLEAETGQALTNLRDLARGIYPPLLAEQGIGPALEAQTRGSVIPITVNAGGIDRYPQSVESAIYFAALEALQNVAKYADASKAEVSIVSLNGHLSFSVSDDGRGFTPSTTSFGTGLRGIADRLETVGGTLEVRSAPGEGTTIMGRVPAREGASA